MAIFCLLYKAFSTLSFKRLTVCDSFLVKYSFNLSLMKTPELAKDILELFNVTEGIRISFLPSFNWAYK